MHGFVDETQDIPELFTVPEVATQLGVSEQYVRMLLRCELLGGKMIGNRWAITPSAVESFLEGKKAQTEPDQQRSKKTNGPKVKALSFFSGAMGLDLGLEKAGIEILLTCENDPSCRKTIVANKPNIALIGDIRQYSAAEIREFAGLSPNDDVDLVVGGPPCQAFSTAGARKGLDDDRGNVFLKYLELIAELRPKYAVIENVRGLLSAPLSHRPHSLRNGDLADKEKPGGVLMMIVGFLRMAGYSVSFNLYNAANFGSPQIRERVVLLCHRGKDKLPYLTPTHSETGNFGLPKWRTFSEAIEGLPEDQHYVSFPENRIKFYKMLGPGQYWKHLPLELQKEALGKSFYAGGGKTGFFRRLAWDRPAPTLVTHPAMPATDLAHPVLNRPLSIEEYKRVQEFPDDYQLSGTLIDQYRQVGNAVPASLGKAIGEAVLAHMRGELLRQIPDFSFSRYRETDYVSWEARMKGEPVQRVGSKNLSIESILEGVSAV